MTRSAGQPGEPEAERGVHMRLEDNERKKMLTIFAKNLPTYRKGFSTLSWLSSSLPSGS